MNSCILMVEIVQEPQLRYTPEQTALAEMLVQFPGLRAEDPPATLKVVGWGNLAQEIQQHYHQGDRVVIEGRLNMNSVQLEGFKEKRAELTVQRIHSLGDGVSIGSAAPERNATAPGMETRETQATSRSRSPSAAPSNDGAFSVDTRIPEKVEQRASTGSFPQSDPAKVVPPPTTPQVPTYPIHTTEADVDDIPF